MPSAAVGSSAALRMRPALYGYTSARQDAPFFTEICGEFATSGRADRVVGPYKGLRPQAHAANFSRADTAITNNDGLFRQ